MKDYPYQNRELESLKDEVWKQIPELESYYHISNFGRIKRLARTLAGKTLPELIIAQTVSKSYNAYTKDYKQFLRVTITVNKLIYNISPARLVYFCFVEEFDLQDKNLFIFFKDENSLNIHPNNLILGDQKEKQRRLEQSGRKENPFKNISPEKRQQIQQKINEIKAKNPANEISRYSLSGKLIETYHNAEVAAKAMNTNASTLSKAARNILLTCKGYIWRRGKESETDISALQKIKGIYRSPAVKHIQRIGQYDFQGNLVQTFTTIKEAAKAVKITYTNLANALKQNRISAAGHLWRYSTKSKINTKKLTELPGFNHSPASANSRKISSYDFKGIWQASYKNIAEASRKTNTDSKSITMAINQKLISAGGRLWQSGTALRINPQHLKSLAAYKNSGLERYNKKKKTAKKPMETEQVI